LLEIKQKKAIGKKRSTPNPLLSHWENNISFMNESKQTIILGLSCFYHDSAAAILVDGKVIAAAQEERFTRIKHDENFPRNAVEYCLSFSGFTIKDVDYVVFYDKPITKFERLLQTYIKVWPRGLRSFIMAMETWLKKKLWIEGTIAKELKFDGKILFTEHHYSHAANAYYCSDFDEATIITVDGVGEWDTTTIGHGKGGELKLEKSISFPHSLGLLYSALTYYLGFKVNSAEYKVMGLAPYGNPNEYYDKFKELIEIKEDGGYHLNMKYFSYEYGQTMTNKNFDKLFGAPPRNPESELTQRDKDIASALQKITEEVMLKIVKYAHSLYPTQNLCIAGGVALNCVANGKILKHGPFKNVYIQPASGDAGGAIGAACLVYYDMLGNKKESSATDTIYLGPQFSDQTIKDFLDSKELDIKYKFLGDKETPSILAKLISENYVIGLFQGRMEFGPRALGNRSIIADARNKENWQRVNLKIKFRESFRPFAPSILEEQAEKYFDLGGQTSPYMLMVAKANTQDLPAVTHVDNSARIQTINQRQNKKFYDIIKEFEKLTGCPAVINTSFNVRGEPIVCTPKDAFNTFLNTDMDYLVLGNYLVSKADNPKLKILRNTNEYLTTFVLD